MNLVDCFDLESKSWNSLPSMTTPRHGLGKIITTFLDLRDLLLDQLIALSELWFNSGFFLCSLAGVGVLGGPLYAVGGHDGWSYLNSVERWDPNTREWNYTAPMSTQRSTVGVAVLNDRLD
jgi:kelch-like protein 1/4/5